VRVSDALSHTRAKVTRGSDQWPGSNAKSSGLNLATPHATAPTRAAAKEAPMKYALGFLIGIPIPILAIYFLATHC
jgi:hypothetical protein